MSHSVSGGAAQREGVRVKEEQEGTKRTVEKGRRKHKGYGRGVVRHILSYNSSKKRTGRKGN